MYFKKIATKCYFTIPKCYRYFKEDISGSWLLVHPFNTREFFMFQSTVSGLSGQVAVKHAVQDSRQDLFWFQQKMEARIVQAQKVEDAT